MRIYEYAKQVKIPAKTIMELLAKGGFAVATHFVALTDEMRAYLEKELTQQAAPKVKKKHTQLNKQRPILSLRLNVPNRY